MIASLFFLIPVLTAPNISTSNITLNAPGWSVQHVCKELSRQTGRSYIAEGSIASDNVIIQVHDVPLKTFLQKLALVEHGDWHKDGQAIKLQQGSALIAKLNKQSQEDDAHIISNLFRTYNKKFDKPFNSEELKSKFKSAMDKAQDTEETRTGRRPTTLDAITFAEREVSRLMPIPKASFDLLQAIGAETVATLPLAQRVVFSNHPTSLQRSFPASCNDLLKNLVTDQEQWSEAVTELGFSTKVVPEFESNRDYGLLFGNLASNDTFCLAVTNHYGRIACSLRIYNRLSRLVASSSLQYFEDPRLVKMPSIAKVNVPIPVVAQRIAKLTAQLAPGDPTLVAAQKDSQLQAIFSHPFKNDPLSLIAAPCLEAIAEKSGQNLIAGSDALLGVFIQGINWGMKSVNIDDVRGSYFGQVFKVDSTPKWLLVSNKDVRNAALFHLDRPSFAHFIHLIAKKKTVDPLEFAKLVSKSNASGYGYASTLLLYGNVLTGDGNSLLQAISSSSTVAGVVGALDASQLALAQSPTGLRFSALSPTQAQTLKHLLLTQWGMFPFIPINNDQKAGLAFEPTWCFAKGLPQNGLIRIKAQHPMCLTWKGASFPNFPPLMLADDYLYSNNQIPKVINYGYGNYLTIMISSGTYNTYPLTTEIRFGPGKLVSVQDWHNLPSDAVKVIEDRLAQDKALHVPMMKGIKLK